LSSCSSIWTAANGEAATSGTRKLSGVTWRYLRPLGMAGSTGKKKKGNYRSPAALVHGVGCCCRLRSNQTYCRAEDAEKRLARCRTVRAPAFPAHPHCNGMHRGKLRLACKKATKCLLGLSSVNFLVTWTRLATFLFTLHQANQESVCARGNQKKKTKGAGSGARNDCRLRMEMIAAAWAKNGLWVGQTEMIVACVAYSFWAL
jgi:hypothetical protein